MQYGYCKPEMDNSDRIDIREGRHPVVEQRAQRQRCLSPTMLCSTAVKTAWPSSQVPNMAGKSTYMRQVALIVIMAQMRQLCACRFSAACRRVRPRVYRASAHQTTCRPGVSTFMVEMSEVSRISCSHATAHKLCSFWTRSAAAHRPLTAWPLPRAVLEYVADKKNTGRQNAVRHPLP